MEEEKLKGVYISKEAHRKIKQLAASTGRTMREITEELIARELEKNGRDNDQRNDS